MDVEGGVGWEQGRARRCLGVVLSPPLLLLLPNQAKVRAAHCRLLLELLPTPADGDYNLLARREEVPLQMRRRINLLMRMRIQISWSAILMWYLESFLSLSVINIASGR